MSSGNGAGRAQGSHNLLCYLEGIHIGTGSEGGAWVGELSQARQGEGETYLQNSRSWRRAHTDMAARGRGNVVPVQR